MFRFNHIAFVGGEVMSEKSKSKINLPKLKTKQAKLIFIAAVVLVFVIILCVAFALIISNKKDKEANAISGCTLENIEFEDVESIKILNDSVLVFKNSAGKYGIMKSDGTITAEAKQDKIYVAEDEWRHYIIVAEGPDSEYPLRVDVESGTVTSRQYHGLTQPEKFPFWSEETKGLVWADEKGTLGNVKSGELSLDEGLYPIPSSNSSDAKYGYIGQTLMLEIALMYEDAKDFSDGMAAVKKGGYWGYINENGVIKVGFDYDSSYSFSDGLVPVCSGNLWGIINKSGETVVDFGFELLLPGENGKYLGKKDGKWYIATVDENLLEKAEDESQSAQGAQVSGGNYVVKTQGSSLRIRATASTTGAVIAQIPNGTTITVTESVPGWAKVTYASATGWVSTDYIEEIGQESPAADENVEVG